MVKLAGIPSAHVRPNGREHISHDSEPESEPPAHAWVPGRMRILRLAQVMERTELRKTTIYKLQKLGRFPKAVPLTGHSVRWVESEVDAWLASRAAARQVPQAR